MALVATSASDWPAYRTLPCLGAALQSDMGSLEDTGNTATANVSATVTEAGTAADRAGQAAVLPPQEAAAPPQQGTAATAPPPQVACAPTDDPAAAPRSGKARRVALFLAYVGDGYQARPGPLGHCLAAAAPHS